ncbi:mechanosensitive ion channel family protein [Curvivirga aplysinae]|uniref:mechanosensitive ion channel family protein n=1 Tax=Curvivirga aplysinae TaxID=2529852 RepID=UPI0012BC3D95|nr:mechanosensitive ion channel domain-containing protein [Curvivirga aplysinae]MTI09153.1 mechanosensitive ion channel [Curvivirga aplysinae]
MFEKLEQVFYSTVSYLDSWIREELLTLDSGLQLSVLLVIAIVLRLYKRRLLRFIEHIKLTKRIELYETQIKKLASALISPLIALFFLWFAVFAFDQVGIHSNIINTIVSLLNAWVVIRLISGVIEDSNWSKVIGGLVWLAAALNIVGLLDITTQFLRSLSFSLGNVTFSALGMIKGIFAIAILFWVFSLLERFINRKITSFASITPSAKVLLSKFVRISLIFFGILISLDAVGIDLTALAVFSGAIGIGLGFGLQKVAANLISGVILLVDRSVKPGDIISLGETYGRIDKLGGRYVSVITRDGTEHLIPNEELITQRVENWSFSDTNVRQKVLISIDYNSDLDLAMQLCLEACEDVDRIVNDPSPRCLLLDFADSGVHIEIRYWVSDAENGLGGVRSDFLKLIWRKFHDHGIDFPYPQRDIHIRGAVPVEIVDKD